MVSTTSAAIILLQSSCRSKNESLLSKKSLQDLQRLVGGTDIRFTDDTPAGSVWHADRGQMEQVFLNLLKNAREACRNCPEPEIIVHANKQKERIIFTIKDNGEGILPEVRERIFVPFFTTKPNGHRPEPVSPDHYPARRKHSGSFRTRKRQ